MQRRQTSFFFLLPFPSDFSLLMQLKGSRVAKLVSIARTKRAGAAPFLQQCPSVSTAQTARGCHGCLPTALPLFGMGPFTHVAQRNHSWLKAVDVLAAGHAMGCTGWLRYAWSPRSQQELCLHLTSPRGTVGPPQQGMQRSEPPLQALGSMVPPPLGAASAGNPRSSPCCPPRGSLQSISFNP